MSAKMHRTLSNAIEAGGFDYVEGSTVNPVKHFFKVLDEQEHLGGLTKEEKEELYRQLLQRISDAVHAMRSDQKNRKDEKPPRQ